MFTRNFDSHYIYLTDRVYFVYRCVHIYIYIVRFERKRVWNGNMITSLATDLYINRFSYEFIKFSTQ